MQSRLPKSSDVYDITNTVNLCALVPFSKDACEILSIATETPKLVYHTLKMSPRRDALQNKSTLPYMLDLKSLLVDCVRTIVFFGSAAPSLRVTWSSPGGQIETYTSPFKNVSEGVYEWSRDAFSPNQSVLLLNETECEINSPVDGVVVYEGILYPTFDRKKRMESSFPFRSFDDITARFRFECDTNADGPPESSYTPSSTLFVKDGTTVASLFYDNIAFRPSYAPFRITFDGKIRLVVTRELVDAIRSGIMKSSGYYDEDFDICYLAMGTSSTCNVKSLEVERM